MRGIAHDRDPAGPPAGELAGLVGVVAPLGRQAADRRFELRKGGHPDIGAHRNRGRLAILDRRHHRQIEGVRVAGHVEDAERAVRQVPEIDHPVPAARAELVEAARGEHADQAERAGVAFLLQTEGVADARMHAVGADHEIGRVACAIGGQQHPLRLGADDFGAGQDLDAAAFRLAEDRGVEGLAGHGQHAAAHGDIELGFGDHAVAVADLVDRAVMRAGDRLVTGADRLQHAEPVLPDEDAGAEGAQRVGALMHPDRPAAVGQRHRGDQPGEAGARDLGVAARTHPPR